MFELGCQEVKQVKNYLAKQFTNEWLSILISSNLGEKSGSSCWPNSSPCQDCPPSRRKFSEAGLLRHHFADPIPNLRISAPYVDEDKVTSMECVARLSWAANGISNQYLLKRTQCTLRVQDVFLARI